MQSCKTTYLKAEKKANINLLLDQAASCAAMPGHGYAKVPPVQANPSVVVSPLHAAQNVPTNQTARRPALTGTATVRADPAPAQVPKAVTCRSRFRHRANHLMAATSTPLRGPGQHRAKRARRTRVGHTLTEQTCRSSRTNMKSDSRTGGITLQVKQGRVLTRDPVDRLAQCPGPARRAMVPPNISSTVGRRNRSASRLKRKKVRAKAKARRIQMASLTRIAIPERAVYLPTLTGARAPTSARRLRPVSNRATMRINTCILPLAPRRGQVKGKGKIKSSVYRLCLYRPAMGTTGLPRRVKGKRRPRKSLLGILWVWDWGSGARAERH